MQTQIKQLQVWVTLAFFPCAVGGALAHEPIEPLTVSQPSLITPDPSTTNNAARAGTIIADAKGFSAPGGYVSPWLTDILKLVRAGIDETVMLTFIDSAGT